MEEVCRINKKKGWVRGTCDGLLLLCLSMIMFGICL